MSGRAGGLGWVVRAVTAVVLALGLTTACGAPGPELSERSAAELQTAVLGVAEASAQGRYDAAAVALDQVRAALDAAVEAGSVSVRRYREIDRAILRTAVELEALGAEGTGPSGG